MRWIEEAIHQVYNDMKIILTTIWVHIPPLSRSTITKKFNISIMNPVYIRTSTTAHYHLFYHLSRSHRRWSTNVLSNDILLIWFHWQNHFRFEWTPQAARLIVFVLFRMSHLICIDAKSFEMNILCFFKYPNILFISNNR